MKYFNTVCVIKSCAMKSAKLDLNRMKYFSCLKEITNIHRRLVVAEYKVFG